MNKKYRRLSLMKAKLFTLATALIFVSLSSCQRNEQSNEIAEEDIQNTIDATADNKNTLPYLTEYNTETDRFEINENADYNHSATQEDLREALNAKYPDIQMEITKQSHDTLFVDIPNAAGLTQRSGTTGAMAYIAEATYAFTSLYGIHVVDFSFAEGDHAVPGPYTRDSFKDLLR